MKTIFLSLGHRSSLFRPGLRPFLWFILVAASCRKQTQEMSSKELKTAANVLYYYVDGTNGNDKNDGQSLSTAWKTIQQSFTAATPGSVVAIRGGTYQEQLTVKVSGTAGNPITFTNYNSEQVIIDGSKNTGTVIITIADRSFLYFRNLTIRNITKNNAMGIYVSASATGGSNSLTFRNLIVKNINWTASTATTPNDNDNAQAFIAYGYGGTQASAITNLTIDSCEFTGNITGFSESVSVDGNVDTFNITNNKVHDNSNIGIAAEGNYGTSKTAALDHARNGFIGHNICFNNNAAYATSGGIYVDGGQHIKVEGNLCYQNGYGIEVGNEQNGSASNITVADNLIYLNQVSGLAIGGYDTKTTGQVLNCVIRNNTFIQNNTNGDGSGEMDITKASNCTFENNIFYTNKENTLFSLEPITPQAGNHLNYNCWFTAGGDPANINVNWLNNGYSSFADYRTGTGQDANSLFADPLLVQLVFPSPDLHLKTGSPCIQKGDLSLITDPLETDYDGKPRIVNGKVDMGAYEIQ